MKVDSSDEQQQNGTFGCIQCFYTWRAQDRNHRPMYCPRCRATEWYEGYKKLVDLEKEWGAKARANNPDDIYVI